MCNWMRSIEVPPKDPNMAAPKQFKIVKDDIQDDPRPSVILRAKYGIEV